MTAIICEDLQPGIVTVTMNRPDNRNALSMAQVTALQQSFAALGERRDCRVIILTGTGSGFCTGADLQDKQFAAGNENLTKSGYVVEAQQLLVDMLLTIRELEKPIIAAINGAAIGGGLALALVSDIRVTAESAQFAAGCTKFGVSACDVGVSYLLPRIVGASCAAELMLTGRTFDASEAQRIGMTHEVVNDSQLMTAALKTAELIVGNSEKCILMTKQALRASPDAGSLRQAIEQENRTQVLDYFNASIGLAQHSVPS